jgi:hypothetical protein
MILSKISIKYILISTVANVNNQKGIDNHPYSSIGKNLFIPFINDFKLVFCGSCNA